MVEFTVSNRLGNTINIFIRISGEDLIHRTLLDDEDDDYPQLEDCVSLKSLGEQLVEGEIMILDLSEGQRTNIRRALTWLADPARSSETRIRVIQMLLAHL